MEPAPTAPSGKTLLLLVNLGTPSAPTRPAIRRFLRPFLSDRRVVDVTPFIWLPILYCFILPFRPGRLVDEYRSIWIGGLSPLLFYGVRLRAHVEVACQKIAAEEALSADGKPATGPVAVALAMRCDTDNNIPAVLARAHEENPFLESVIVLPLFPQYSSATTASMFDEVFRFYLNPWRRRVPSLHMIRDYADEPLYVAAIADGILAALLAYCGGTADTEKAGEQLAALGDQLVLVLSYHSIPYRYQAEGDDYAVRCTLTTTAVTAYLSRKLGYAVSSQVVQVYQSKFGKKRWLEPFFTDAMCALPLAPTTEESRSKKQELARNLGRPEFATRQGVICFVSTPGFAADCLETLCEVNEDGARIFKENGGSYFEFVPCLNDSPAHAQALVAVAQKYM